MECRNSSARGATQSCGADRSYVFTINIHPRESMVTAIQRAEDWLDMVGMAYVHLYFHGTDFVDLNTAVCTFEAYHE